MKQIKTLVAAFVLLLGASSFVNAQSKVAHIDTQKLISEMPEMIAAQKQLSQLEKTYTADIEAKFTEYQNKIKQYSAEAENQTDATNQARQEEVANMEKEIAKYRDDATKDIAKRREDLIKPLLEKAKVAIEKVAAAQGFDYVVDSTPGGGVIMADGKDLMADVKKELGF